MIAVVGLIVRGKGMRERQNKETETAIWVMKNVAGLIVRGKGVRERHNKETEN